MATKRKATPGRAAGKAPKARKKTRPNGKQRQARARRSRAQDEQEERTEVDATALGMFRKIAFTMFPVVDATRARAFYEDVLGFRRGLASADGVWTEYDLPGGGCLALFRHPVPELASPPGGGVSVAFEVADLDTVNERLAAAGVAYQGEMVHGPNCRMSSILDSEGNSIILHQLNRDV